MPNNPIVLPRGLASADGTVASGTQVSVDATSLTHVTAVNAQEVTNELNRAFDLIASGQTGQPSTRFDGQFVPFTGSVNIGPTNFDLYSGKIALYANSANARVNFILPTDAEITAEGVATDASVEYTILNQAGTARFDTGFTPTNTVVIDVEGANNIRRGTATGTLLNFIEAHQNDLVTLTQSARGEPWVAVRVTLSNAALLLPSGLFRLNVGVQASLNPALGFIAGLPSGVTPQAGDAYQVSVGNDDFGGFGVEQGDVIVALQDNPSRINSATNDDWLVIRNNTNDIITLTEIRFLNTVMESDTFTFSRVEERSDVTAVRMFLSTGVLDHAPFISPSTDPDNPQDDGVRYAGGDEDVGSDNDFSLTDFTKVGEPAGSNRFPSALVYLDIDGSFDLANNVANIFVQHKNSGGDVVNTYSLNTQFRALTLTGSSDNYYVLNTVSQADDNFSTVNYNRGDTFEVVLRTANRTFTFSDAVNVVNSIGDGTIDIAKLSGTVQSLLNSDHTLSTAQEQKLAGLQLTAQSEALGNTFAFYASVGTEVSSNFSEYHEIEQQNGILPDYERTISYVLLVDPRVEFTQLQKVESTTTKQDVTAIGAVTIPNDPQSRQFIAYRVTLPAITGANSVLDNAWQIDGTLDTSVLSGAADSFKNRTVNYNDNSVTVEKVSQTIRDGLNSGSSYTPPQKLTDLLDHITLSENTVSGWRDLTSPIFPITFTREFKYLFSQSRTDISAGTSQFSDITGALMDDFAGNNVFVYSDSNRQYNTAAPLLNSYILDTNVHIGNASGQTTVSDSNNKLVGFSYYNQEIPDSSGNETRIMVRHGSGQPLLGFSHDEGLFAYIARNDGGSHTRTREIPLQVDGGHWHDQVDQVINAEAEIIVPSSLSGSLTVVIEIQLDDDGNDEGTHVETITITNVGADQTIGDRTFSYSGFPSVTTTITYDHDNNDLSNTRRVLFLRPTQPFTNAALTYNVRAHYSVTDTWNTGTTYARFPVNAGDAHDQFGLFDPVDWHTERTNVENRVRYCLINRFDRDTSSDPEQSLLVIAEGDHNEDVRSTYTVNINRPLSDFDNDDIRLGNNAAAIGEIIGFQASDRLSIDNLVTLDNEDGENFGLATDRDDVIENLLFDGSIEIGSGHSIIMTDTDTSVRKQIEVSSGAIAIKDA